MPRLALLAAGPRQMRGFQCQDREHAGHQVEQQATDQSAEHRPPQSRHVQRADRDAAAGNRAGGGGELEAAVVAERQHGGKSRRLAALALQFGDERVPGAPKALRRRIIDLPVDQREDIGLTQCDAGGKRDGEAQLVAGKLEMRRGSERTREQLPPLVEAGPLAGGALPDRHLQREAAALRHADLVGAGQPLRLGGDGQHAACVSRCLQSHQHRMVALVDVVHQPADVQPLRHRIAEWPKAGAARQRPFDLHWQTGVARVLPIAVPTLAGVHDDRQIDLAARPHRSFGDQLRLDGVDARLLCRRRRG